MANRFTIDTGRRGRGAQILGGLASQLIGQKFKASMGQKEIEAQKAMASERVGATKDIAQARLDAEAPGRAADLNVARETINWRKQQIATAQATQKKMEGERVIADTPMTEAHAKQVEYTAASKIEPILGKQGVNALGALNVKIKNQQMQGYSPRIIARGLLMDQTWKKDVFDETDKQMEAEINDPARVKELKTFREAFSKPGVLAVAFPGVMYLESQELARNKQAIDVKKAGITPKLATPIQTAKEKRDVETFDFKKATSIADLETKVFSEDENESKAGISAFNKVSDGTKFAYRDTVRANEGVIIDIPPEALKDGWTPAEIKRVAGVKKITPEALLKELGLI